MKTMKTVNIPDCPYLTIMLIVRAPQDREATEVDLLDSFEVGQPFSRPSVLPLDLHFSLS